MVRDTGTVPEEGFVIVPVVTELQLVSREESATATKR
jgi:hypothetical protein